jgi:DNA-binding CsgD family transcriptional regulator
MKSKLKPSGLFCGSIFLAAALFNFFYSLTIGRTFLEALQDYSHIDLLVVIATIFLVSAFVPALAWLQPAIFLAMTPFTLLAGNSSFYGLGFYAGGILFLFKLGFYERHRAAKVACSIGYLMVAEIVMGLRNGQSIYFCLTPVLFIFAFLFALYLTFRDRIFVYLKEPKPSLSLEAKGLSEAEQVYVHTIIEGRPVRDAALESGVSESTVRNTLARAYKKLGVANRAGLLALAEKYDVIK